MGANIGDDRESFIQQYFPSMMAKAVGWMVEGGNAGSASGGGSALPSSGRQQGVPRAGTQQSTASTAAAAPPPPYTEGRFAGAAAE